MNNLNFKLISIFTSLILIFNIFNTNAQHKYIDQNKGIAHKLSKEYGIPSAIILSIAFVETGGGTSKLCKISNNHFGIVGRNTKIKSKYKHFQNTEESYRYFCQMITRKKYYTTLKGEVNTQKWVNAIASAGYSTQPDEWKRRVNLIIEKYNL